MKFTQGEELENEEMAQKVEVEVFKKAGEEEGDPRGWAALPG